MIKIEAIVRPERVNLVVDALEAAGCAGYHLFNIHGAGQQGGVEVFTGRGTGTATRSALPKTLITVVVSEASKDSVVAAIIDSAKTGEEGAIGDGKIFITEISDAIRVRTGERGDSAL